MLLPSSISCHINAYLVSYEHDAISRKHLRTKGKGPIFATLTLCVIIDPSSWFDTVHVGRFTEYIDGSQVMISKYQVLIFLILTPTPGSGRGVCGQNATTHHTTSAFLSLKMFTS